MLMRKPRDWSGRRARPYRILFAWSPFLFWPIGATRLSHSAIEEPQALSYAYGVASVTASIPRPSTPPSAATGLRTNPGPTIKWKKDLQRAVDLEIDLQDYEATLAAPAQAEHGSPPS